MFSFIKSLFGGTTLAEAVPDSSTAPVASLTQSSPSRAATPTTLPAAAPQPPTPCLEIPLQPITDRLPPALRSRMNRPPGRSDVVKLALGTALEQLGSGAVRISFRELRQRTSPGIFMPGGEMDETLVDVPLAEVLPRLQPNFLARRSEQKRLYASDDVPGVFTSRQAPGAGKPNPQLDELQSSQLLAGAAQASAPTRVEPVKPAAPTIPAVEHRVPATGLPTPTPRLAPGPTPGARPALSQPAPAMAAAAKRPERTGAKPEAEPVKVPLVSLARNWAEPIHREIMRTHLAASVQIPFMELEAAMKQGKAVFKWKQIRLWMGSPLSQALSEHDDLNLELPLPVLTPLFLARHLSKGPAHKVAARPEIPDVFSARKATEPGEEEAVAPAPPAAAPLPVTPGVQSLEQRITESFAASTAPIKAPAIPLPAKSAASAPDKLTLARSNPLPAEVVHKACQLSGVAGALVVTTDGLIIASQLPPGMNAETAAGFLPQIYGRLGQYTRELKLGDPSHVEMLVGNIPLQIYRGHSAFFAVLGKAAEPLPKLQLNGLAGQLSHRTN